MFSWFLDSVGSYKAEMKKLQLQDIVIQRMNLPQMIRGAFSQLGMSQSIPKHIVSTRVHSYYLVCFSQFNKQCLFYASRNAKEANYENYV